MPFPLCPPRFGARLGADGVRFSVWSSAARRLWVSIFDAAGERELEHIPLEPQSEGVHSTFVSGLAPGARYGFRADGDYAPERGLWFDPDKLLVDPYAVAIDRPYRYDPRLAARRGEGGDTASLIPKAIVTDLPAPLASQPPLFRAGGLIYELSVRAFTRLHPDIPEAQRGTIGALAHPAVIEHLKKLGVSAVELMPITAWIDERHLPPLGLSNAWGYNPVSFMALDPRLAPGGIIELRDTVVALRAAGIGVILDLVFNHTGESDELGPTLSLRGLDARAYYRHGEDGRLVNDTGTGNTLACGHAIVLEMILDALRHFVRHTGVDGFRFDLATVLGRTASGFDPDAPLLAAMRADPELADRVMIAEPWDIGPGGYRLGGFRPPFQEWNDRYRDDVRRFWRGDGGVGALATRLAGSSDVFAGATRTRSVNFIAAHDGMTLADLVSYEHKHNAANGEENRDGHDENFSWNNGVEGKTTDAEVNERRERDLRALLSTLFASRGTIMLTAGDEFGRTQSGNNNAYAQDNEITWLDWGNKDLALEEHVAALAALRKSVPALSATDFLIGQPLSGRDMPDVEWLSETGTPLEVAEWNDPERRRLTMLLDGGDAGGGRLAILFNADRRSTAFALPPRGGFWWRGALPADLRAVEGGLLVPGRSVLFARESAVEGER
ncbi:glycogen debranching protein GlgX [Pseudaminobacter soli (ex Li et al. 2025)]|uniref:Glycogen debranching enzyme GlgX n=1 Tax=Pseudaminobacter soli (ex Li et al. 2025) TaxID=1295366 RepID=A0A2P7SFY2_9HYPH|nr:glycogen debranching protein GlgX [Mesorhizobium soli]PSJ61393.1 glycogen debranching enzyme GlgX [Mesorhizobium soli]